MMVKILSFLLLTGFTLHLQAQTTLPVLEDSYVRGGQYANQNYGSSSPMEMKTALNFPEFSRKAYLKFNLSAQKSAWVGDVRLFLYLQEAADFELSASLVSDQWEEGTLTWNNSPLASMLIDSAGMPANGQYISIDITSAFFLEANGDGILSLLLEDRNNQDKLARITAREAGVNPPYLEIRSGDTLVQAPELKYIHLLEGPQLELRWKDRSHNETGFLVERKTGGGPFQPIDTLAFNTVSYLDASVETGKNYSYRIRALNPLVNSEYSGEKQMDLSVTNVPAAVQYFAGTAPHPGRISLEWTYDEFTFGFLLYREKNGTYNLLDSLEADARSYVDFSLTPLTTYRYFVVAYNYLGSSNPSDTLSVTTQDRVSYYFDATLGNDDYPVSSADTPWKTLERINSMVFGPGDSILLKKGEEWKGSVSLKGSGAAGHPITLTSYGEEEGKPLLNGNGFNGPVIRLEDVSHWHLKGLEITNSSGTQGDRLGVLIKSNGGLREHFRLENLHIHDIFGRYSFQMIGKNTGGIGIIGENDSRFDDILIQNNEIHDIVRVGIFTNGNPGVRGDRPITNLVIRNNTLTGCAGDGMIIRYAFRPLIENNLAIDNHNAPEELVEFGVAIWVRSTDEAVIQYNRVFNTRGSKDGQAFDADLDAYRTLVQYNYSANNEGGFMLVYGSSKDAIVRYNISQNDGVKGKHILDFPVWTSPRGSAIVHNNVFYLGEGNEAALVDEALPSTKIYNNIVINRGGGPLVVRSEGQTAVFSHNCLIGYSPEETALNQEPVEGDPLLMDPGTGGTEFSSLDGYQILAGSPCTEQGLPVSEMAGSYWADLSTRDFWGNPVIPGYLDVGAHQLTVLSERLYSYWENQGKLNWNVVPVPFRNGFHLSFYLPETTNLEIKMFDLSGRYVDSLIAGEMRQGLHKLYYDIQEKPAMKSGVYLLNLIARDLNLSESKVVVKE